MYKIHKLLTKPLIDISVHIKCINIKYIYYQRNHTERLKNLNFLFTHYREMLKTITTALILGLTIWTIRAQDSECIRQELERELQEYVKLESWQQLFRRHTKLYVNSNGDLLSERKRLKFNTIIHNVCIRFSSSNT